MRFNTLILIAASALSAGASAQNHSKAEPAACSKPVYLTLDTGHMGVANQIADVLRQELSQRLVTARNAFKNAFAHLLKAAA